MINLAPRRHGIPQLQRKCGPQLGLGVGSVPIFAHGKLEMFNFFLDL